MNKVVLKEYEGKLLIIDIMLYCMFIVVGFVLLNFPLIDKINPMEYAAPLFYMFAFFSLLAYFLNRKKGDYELLIFGFINVCVASFILIYESYPDCGFILADAVLIYSIANVLNKGYHCGKLLQQRNTNFFIKTAVTVLLLFLGVFVVSSLYTKVEAGSMILGYYFVILGLLSLFEPLMEILMKNQKIEKIMLDFLANETVSDKEKNQTKKVTKKEENKKPIKEVKNHKVNSKTKKSTKK